MYLYHYFDRNAGAFRSISELNDDDAQKVLENIKLKKPESMCAKRQDSYVADRRHYEDIVRRAFAAKGGRVLRDTPHYMVVEECPWLESWYDEPAFVKIDVGEFDLDTLSFTYGDSHPTFSPRVNDGKEYRRQVYTYDEILYIIEKYGLPQVWNSGGEYGPERYIEVQVWDDSTIAKYK